jgi:toxin ParE1/3/4
VKWSVQAWSDLADVADHIAKDSRYYAGSFIREVREAARSLKLFPERGSVVPEWGDDNIREIFVRRYRLIYQVGKKEVLILGFIHGARDLQALWRKEQRPGRDE